jgi:hypothetical protein
MRKLWMGLSVAAVLVGVTLTAPEAAFAADSEIRCEIDFSLHGWSFFYKTAEGKGKVTCSNGQSMRVKLYVTRGGLTVGKSTIDNGHGVFSGLYNIKEVLGSYAAGTAHAVRLNPRRLWP